MAAARAVFSSSVPFGRRYAATTWFVGGRVRSTSGCEFVPECEKRLASRPRTARLRRWRLSSQPGHHGEQAARRRRRAPRPTRRPAWDRRAETRQEAFGRADQFSILDSQFSILILHHHPSSLDDRRDRLAPRGSGSPVSAHDDRVHLLSRFEAATRSCDPGSTRVERDADQSLSSVSCMASTPSIMAKGSEGEKPPPGLTSVRQCHRHAGGDEIAGGGVASHFR